MRLALLLLLVLTACGRGLDTAGSSDSEFTQYIANFSAEANRRNARMRSIAIHFGEVATEHAAECRTATGQIVVDRTKWEQLTDRQQRILVFHELGHCALGRPHFDDEENHRALSIMNSHPLAPHVQDYVVRFEAAYLDELFNGDQI